MDQNGLVPRRKGRVRGRRGRASGQDGWSAGPALRAVAAVFTGAGLLTAGLVAAAPSAGAITPGPVSQLVVTAPAHAAVGTAVTVSVTAEDAGGNTVTTFPDTVHFTSSDASAVLPADATLTGGTASFSVTFETAGSQTVTATDITTPALTGTSGAVAVAGPVSQLVVTAPAAATIGTPVTVSVTAEDAGGNTATTYAGVVHFTSSDGAAVLPADATLTGGTGSFAVTFETAGSQTVTATDTVTAALTGTSGAVVVGTGSGAFGLPPASTTTPAVAPSTAGTAQVVDLAGADRIATAIAVSQQSFPSSGSAGAVVLARSDTFADALAGGPLAVAKNAPLLLTPTDSLDPTVQAEIQRVLPSGGTVYLLGGTAALSDSVASSLTGLGFTVVRYAGVDRFDTAAQIATSGLGAPTTVLLATGDDFADALSGGPAAVAAGGAILLTDGPTMPSETSAYLAAHPGTVYALGGPAATADPSATPIVGSDRYQTATMVASKWFSAPSAVGFASGADFPDALAGDAQMGHLGGPMLLLDPTATAAPAEVTTYLTSVAGDLTSAFAYGGSAALPSTLLSTVQASITPTTATSGTATQLQITAPSTVTVGTPFQVTVSAINASSEVVASTDTVQLASSDTTAVLPASSALTDGTGAFT